MAEPAVADNPSKRSALASPPIVAIAAWLLPGAGYWLIGQRTRALVVGVTIITMFMSGMLIGGVREIQVPGYGEGGQPIRTWYEMRRDQSLTGRAFVGERPPRGWEPVGTGPMVVTSVNGLLGELGNKPWSICQVMTGPVAIAGGAWSVSASRTPEGGGEPAGTLSHSRINEIGVLYTAVAGMLNLLVIIDSAGRASAKVYTVIGGALRAAEAVGAIR